MIEGSEHSSENVVIATNVPILPADEENSSWTSEQVEFQNKILSYIIALIAIILGGGVLIIFLFCK